MVASSLIAPYRYNKALKDIYKGDLENLLKNFENSVDNILIAILW